MASTITFIAQDDDGERILDELEQQTSVEPEPGEDDGRTYALEGDEDRLELTDTLDDIDAAWKEHVAIASPT